MIKNKEKENRVLMLYDKDELPEAQFDLIKGAAKYLGKSEAVLRCSISRKQTLRSGHKLLWVNIGEE